MPSIWLNTSSISESPADHNLLTSPRFRISVVPNGEAGLSNRIFSEELVSNVSWMGPNIELFQICRNDNIEIGTCDIVTPESAEVILQINLPRTFDELLQLRKRAPKAVLALLINESPVVQPHAADPRNHRLFDIVFTYESGPGLKGKYCYLPLATGRRSILQSSSVSYSKRRLCALINTNYYSGLRGAGRPWHFMRPYQEILSAGWSLSFSRYLKVWSGTGYHRRRCFARAAESLNIHDMDVFGANWEGKTGGWYYKFFPESPYKNWRGPARGDKYNLLQKYRYAFAYENYSGNEGYLSEKIFDVLEAGCVPVYWGDKNMETVFPREAYINARNFQNDEQVLREMLSWNEDRWVRAVSLGKEFLSSSTIKKYRPQAFAQTIKAAVESAVKSKHLTNRVDSLS